MNGGGERDEEHSAEGQRMHHNCAKVSRRIWQSSRTKSFITVGRFKAPTDPASWQVIVGWALVCLLLVTVAREPNLHSSLGVTAEDVQVSF